METPRHSTDIIICFPCKACNGEGGYGLRRADYNGGQRTPANFSPCSSCNGSGWDPKRPAELTNDQILKLLAKLMAKPHSPPSINDQAIKLLGKQYSPPSSQEDPATST